MLSAKGVKIEGLAERQRNGEGGERQRDGSLNRLLVLAGEEKVRSADQTFLQLHPCVYPIPTVRDWVEGKQRWTSFPTGRVVGDRVHTPLLRRWVEDCKAKHGKACEDPEWLVKSEERVWPQGLRLIDTKDMCVVESGRCEYLCLSYVWGKGDTGLILTRENSEKMGMPGALAEGNLPKTIRDAVALTKELGFRHLWVDRLCVVQDSEADKAVQLPQMDNVYSSAVLTIVAACGTSEDGLAGICDTPRTVDQRTARVADDLAVMSVLKLDETYQNCLWRTRGWTFQEGLCSRRSVMFTSDQVFWSCSTAQCCESITFEDHPTTVKPGDIVWNVLSGHSVFGEFGGANLSYKELGSMIGTYCKRQLGVEEDILSAFEGVLNRVRLTSGHEFYWGHSVSTMFELSLVWLNIVWCYDRDIPNTPVPERRRGGHGAVRADDTSYNVPFPSWSWLGWRNLNGITRVVPKQVNVMPELNIWKLDVNGKAVPVRAMNAKELEPQHPVRWNGVDENTSKGWKEETAIPDHMIHKGGDFEDSGRLVFWTSCADLETKDGKILGRDGEIGELLPMWPHRDKPEGIRTFIVMSRKINDYYGDPVRVEKRLYVLLIEWLDHERGVVERICAGEVDEAGWVGVKRDWRLIILQ
ncbi:HET-domain-containing protein [Xylariaceae sp. FL1272]|nr:HET-domain-containing protein [Xylariaceae sp. FL1272]